MNRLAILVAAGLCLAGCAHSQRAQGQLRPTKEQLAAALGAIGEQVPDPATVEGITCHDIEQEPTEFACSWYQNRVKGSHRERSAILAIDGDGWIVIDGPSDLF